MEPIGLVIININIPSLLLLMPSRSLEREQKEARKGPEISEDGFRTQGGSKAKARDTPASPKVSRSTRSPGTPPLALI